MNNSQSVSWIRKHPYITGAVLLTLVIVTVPSKTVTQPAQVVSTPQPKQVATTTPTLSKEQAQKELDAIMGTAVKAQLVTSYDFKEIANNTYKWDIFVGKNWYVQTVKQKKDFVAYIAIRKKAITGFSHFELHDAYTNEKVAEVTSFSQSIEVYK
ncbi:MAG: hypothetical protein WCT07_00040 [Candidatus Paceibacterota bacterium]|jgi:hypothetical protein